MKIKKSKIPVLIGKLTENGPPKDGTQYFILAVWCPFCKDTHHHGWSDKDKKATHRKEHCSSETGLKAFGETGYMVRPRKVRGE